MRGLPNFRLGHSDNVAIAAFILLAFSLLLGGASRQHELRLALVEISALPVAIIALSIMVRRGIQTEHRFALTLLACVLAVPLIQLVPLPPALWTSIPGRDKLVLALSVVGLPEGWLPLTVTPDRTWHSFLALIPPTAMFIALLVASSDTRLRLVQALLAGIIISTLLGAAQLASGGTQLYPWTTTAAGSVTGFFANRNHLATICLIGIPFATVLGAGSLRRSTGDARLPLWLAVIFIALAAVTLGVIRSRAGIILFGPVLAGSLVAAWVAAGRGRPGPLLLALIGGAALVVAAIGAFTVGPLLARFDTPGTREGRFENWPVVLEAAETYLPLGSGLGSFDTIYRSIEPLNRLDSTYFNQAHNDYLEMLLETGWLGAGLIIAFLIWFSRRAWGAWRAGVSTQQDLQRAASIAVVVVILHSAADYPLRTATIATILALCCGLLELSVLSGQAHAREASPRRRRSRSR